MIMKLTKTETKLLYKVIESGHSSAYGKREVQAATKLHTKGLVEFVDQSMFVDKDGVCQKVRDEQSVFIYQGYLEESK